MHVTIVDFLDNHLLAVSIGVGLIMAYLTVNTLMLVWSERKVSAWIQRRMGPTEVGPFGLVQTLADMLKLLSKQLITPKHVDKWLYHLAPIVVFAPVVAAVSLFPYSSDVALMDTNLGLILVFALAGIGIIAIFMAGWGSNNKYALLGAMRSVAQNISYEIPLILSALSVVLMINGFDVQLEVTNVMTASAGATETQPAQPMNFDHIVLVQEKLGFWFVLLQPVAAVIYFIAAVAETNRAPFDIP